MMRLKSPAVNPNINCSPAPARLTGVMITLGEKNCEISEIMDLITNKIDIFRLNLSHKDLKWHEKVGNNIKNAIEYLSCCPGVIFCPPAVAVDLPGAEIHHDEAINFALNLPADFLIIPNVLNWKIVMRVKDKIRKSESRPICIISRISSSQELDNFGEMLKVSDGIMIDGECLQRSIIAECNQLGKPVILTYRLSTGNSMKLDPKSVAKAVSEGIDTIFIATGAIDVKNTLKLIEDIDLVSRKAEVDRWQGQSLQDVSYKTIPLDPTHGMALAAVEMSTKLNASGIIVTTTTGRTAMLLSIYRPKCPIVAVSRYGIAARWLRVYSGVHPIHYKCPPHPDWNQDMDCRVERAMNYLRQCKYIEPGDPVIVVSGWSRDHGFTHSIRMIYATPAELSRVPDDFEDTW